MYADKPFSQKKYNELLDHTKFLGFILYKYRCNRKTTKDERVLHEEIIWRLNGLNVIKVQLTKNM
jgi:hypothetical protein